MALETDSLSLRDVMLMAGNDDAARITLKWLIAETHSERLEVVTSAIEYVSQMFVRGRQNIKESRGEEGLNQDVVNLLCALGLGARHDVQDGGHCDIYISANNGFVWVGEAKVHRDYDWLKSGFDQLATRYASGLAGQNAGCLLIYHFGQDLKNTMETWKERLAKAYPEVKFSDCTLDPLAFVTTSIHKGSGLEYTMRHKGIPLYHNPSK